MGNYVATPQNFILISKDHESWHVYMNCAVNDHQSSPCTQSPRHGLYESVEIHF